MAHVYRIEENGRPCVAWDDAKEIKVGAKLYAAPREWFGLTSDEIHEAFCHAEYETNYDWNDDPESWCKAFANYIETRLNEKNNDRR